jgi:hypothetical protein
MKKLGFALAFLSLSTSLSYGNVYNYILFIGQVISGATNGAPLVVSSTGKLATGLSTSSVNATGTTTTTSTANPSTAVIASMTQTPVAGTYFVYFCSSFQSNANNIDVLYSLFSGGSLITGSEMTATPQIQGGLTPSLNMKFPGCTIGLATVNGSQAIEARWHVSAAGTATAGSRIMIIMRVQ